MDAEQWNAELHGAMDRVQEGVMARLRTLLPGDGYDEPTEDSPLHEWRLWEAIGMLDSACSELESAAQYVPRRREGA